MPKPQINTGALLISSAHALGGLLVQYIENGDAANAKITIDAYNALPAWVHEEIVQEHLTRVPAGTLPPELMNAKALNPDALGALDEFAARIETFGAAAVMRTPHSLVLVSRLAAAFRAAQDPA